MVAVGLGQFGKPEWHHHHDNHLPGRVLGIAAVFWKREQRTCNQIADSQTRRLSKKQLWTCRAVSGLRACGAAELPLSTLSNHGKNYGPNLRARSFLDSGLEMSWRDEKVQNAICMSSTFLRVFRPPSGFQAWESGFGCARGFLGAWQIHKP